MATLISCSSGSWTEASTWGLCDSTSELDSEGGNNATLTSYSFSSSFTPGAIIVDGIALKLYTRTINATGTATVCIGQGGAAVVGTEVTINVTDISYLGTPSGGYQQSYGWIYFKFTSPVTLTAATAYTVGIKSSNASEINFYTNGTSYNWSRQLRTTTTQAPSTGDKMYVIGEYTGAGTGNNITVTMNNNDTTDYGTGSTTLVSLGVGKRGTLNWIYTATTRLRLSGLLGVWHEGTLNIGTVTNPIGSSYTATLEFDCGANGDFGLIGFHGATIVMQGASRTYDRAYLSVDAAISDTHIHTDVSTGWLDGDEIVIAPTSRTRTEYDTRILNGAASGDTVNITAGLTYAHSSATLNKAEVIMVTRNVVVTSVSSSYKGYIRLCGYLATSTADIDWVQFKYLGSSVGVPKYGITVLGDLDESFSFNRCSFVSNYYGFYTEGAGQSENLDVTNCVFHDNSSHFRVGSSTLTGAGWTITGCWGIYSVGDGLSIGTNGGTITDNRIVGSAYGYLFAGGGPYGTVSDNVAHSCTTGGFSITGANVGGIVTNLTSYLNTTTGIRFASTTVDTIFDNFIAYGNDNAMFFDTGGTNLVRFTGGSINGYTGYPTTSAIRVGSYIRIHNIIFDGMAIGVASGDKTDMTGSYFSYSTDQTNVYIRIIFYNCTWGAQTKYSPSTTIVHSIMYAFHKDGGTESNDYTYLKNGRFDHDTTNGENGGDCLKITPSGNTNYLDLSEYIDLNMFQCPAQDGVARTVYIKLKKTATLDSTNVSLALYQNDTLVDGWDNVVSSLSDSVYTEFGLNYTPTEDGILDMAIKLDGDAGSLYVDSFRWT